MKAFGPPNVTPTAIALEIIISSSPVTDLLVSLTSKVNHAGPSLQSTQTPIFLFWEHMHPVRCDSCSSSRSSCSNS